MRKNDTQARKEHEAIRNSVGFYDFTHQLLEVKGPDAQEFLNKIFVAALGKAEVGDAKYSTMLDEKGIIHDDVIIFRVEENTFWISTLYIKELIAWLDQHRENYDITYTDITEKTTMYAVQGPNSRKVLDDFLDKEVDNMKFFTIEDNKIDNVDVKVARSGYTGELGYEIYCRPEDKELVESKLRESGKEYGIEQITTDVIVTSIPREKGYVLMSDLEGTNPLEVDFGWTIDWDTDFIGKEALEKVKEEGPKRKLLGFTVEDDSIQVEPGATVKKDDVEVGKVTMYTYGFTVEKNIGFALVDIDKANEKDQVLLVSNGTEVEATLCDRVFYDPKNERVRG